MESPHLLFGLNPLWVATALLVIAYIAIIADRVNRALVVGIGACLVIVTGVLSQDEAIRGVDWNTIMLLAGMMLIVGIAGRTGLFEYVAIHAVKLARARPAAILALLAIITAVFSALLDNVTTVLLVAPVTLAITRQLEVDPWPYLFAEIMASNVGGTATLVGDPPNIMIGSAVGFTFNDFLFNLGPVVVIIVAVHGAIGHLVWGRRLRASDEARARVLAMDERESITNPRLLRHVLMVLGGVVAAFVTARYTHLEVGTIAMFGAAILLLLDVHDRTAEEQAHHVHSSFGEVEWITLFFFIGLFVMVEGVSKTGLLTILGEKLLAATGGDPTVTVLAVLWVSALLSAVLDNIPFVATMIPLVKGLEPAFGGATGLHPVWWALALGACLGGNGTLIGASANLTVAGLAERAGVPFRFSKFTARAFPLMLLSVGIAHVYLWLRYLR
ncbi:MAG: ArsB/NhaD family transporter [Gemmatimonadales bacterium]